MHKKYFLRNCITFLHFVSEVCQYFNDRKRLERENNWIIVAIVYNQLLESILYMKQKLFSIRYYVLHQYQSFEQEMSQLFSGSTLIQFFLKTNFQYIKVHLIINTFDVIYFLLPFSESLLYQSFRTCIKFFEWTIIFFFRVIGIM